MTCFRLCSGVIALLIFLSINMLTAFAQTTVLSPSCIADPIDSSRNILEITGNEFSSTIFNITSPINNCHIHIHDLTATAINITSPTIKNSNITIRNVVSGNKSIATFMWFKGSISNFSFIDISNVAHSSLAIDASSGNDWISIVKFDGAITGKFDLTSTISISNLEMNNIVCNRTLLSSAACSSAFVYFNSTIANIGSFTINGLAMNNILSVSSSQKLASLSSVYFNGALTCVHRIKVTKVEVRNVDFRNTVGSCQAILLKFALPVAAPSENSDSSEFKIEDAVIQNFTSSTVKQGESNVRFLHVGGAISNFSIILLRNIHVASVNSISRAGNAVIFILRFESSVDAPSSSSPSLIIADGSFEKSTCTAQGSALTMFFYVRDAITNYSAFQMTNLSVTGLNSSSRGADAFLYVATFAWPILAPASLVSSAAPSMLLVDNVKFTNSTVSAAKYSQMWIFGAGDPVENYAQIRFSNLEARLLRATSLAGLTFLYVMRFDTPVTGPAIIHSASATSLVISNVRAENITASSGTSATLVVVGIGGIVSNYNVVQIMSVTALSLDSYAPSAGSTLFLLDFDASIAAPVSPSPSMLIINNIRFENSSSTGLIKSRLYLFYVGGAVTDYDSVKFTNITAVALNATASAGRSYHYLLFPVSGITARVGKSATTPSALVVDRIRVQQTSSTGSLEAQMYVLQVGYPVTRFDTIQLTDVAVASLNSFAAAGSSYVHILYFAWSATATEPRSSSPSSSFVLDNITSERVASVGITYSFFSMVYCGFGISNFNTFQFTNVSGKCLTSDSPSGSSYLYFAYIGRRIIAPSFASASLRVENIELVSSSATAEFSSTLWVTYFGAVSNYFSVQCASIAASNNMVSSSFSSSTLHAIYLDGISNCRNGNFDNIQVTNTTAITGSSYSSATISLLSCNYWAIFANVSNISLRNSRINQVSFSFSKKSALRLFNPGASLEAELFLLDNNSVVLAGVLSTSLVDVVSVSIVVLTSPQFMKMEIKNNILSILDESWKEICSPAICSIVRVEDVADYLTSEAALVSISNSEIISGISSFISFANYTENNNYWNNASPLVKFVLKNNKMNCDDFSNAPSLIGFDSPPPSSPFPSLAFVEVKCNQWSKAADRSYEQELLSMTVSPAQLLRFIDWTCYSSSQTQSSSDSPEASISASQSASDMSTSSRSISTLRVSESPLSSASKITNITPSISTDRSESRTVRTFTDSPTPFNNPSPFVLKISEAVDSALLASDGTQAAAMLSVAVFASISSSPALGFTIGRQQAMMDFVQKSLRGDCRGLLPATTVENFEDEVSNPLGLGNSPTQLSIGGSEKLMSYYVGAVIGNCILAVGLVVLNLGTGMAILTFLNSRISSIKKFIKKNKVASMMKERCGGFTRRNEPLKKMLTKVFARSYVSLTLFFCLSFLLTPTLSSALIILVAARNDPKLESQQVSGYLKLASVVCAIAFSAISLYFVAWSVKLRKKRREKYRSLRELGLEEENEPRAFVTRMFKARGEWSYPAVSFSEASAEDQNSNNERKAKKKHNREAKKHENCFNDFLIAEPAFESYRTEIWFAIVEVATTIALAFPPFVAQFALSAKSSCFYQGILLLVILVIYTTILLWKNPFKLRILRITNPVLSLQQLVIVTISLVLVATRSGNTSEESPSWFWKILMMPLAFQSCMSVMMAASSVFPILMFLNKVRARGQRREVVVSPTSQNSQSRNASMNVSTTSTISVNTAIAPQIINHNNENRRSKNNTNNYEKIKSLARRVAKRTPLETVAVDAEMSQLL